MDEFDSQLVAAYLSDNWARFLRFALENGIDSDDAERILKHLQGG